MFWPIFVYLVASVAISVTAGWAPGLHAAGSSLLALAAGGGWRASLRGDRTQKIAGSVIAIVILALAVWLAGGFSVHAYGHQITGPIWALIGFAVCFVFADRRLTGP